MYVYTITISVPRHEKRNRKVYFSLGNKKLQLNICYRDISTLHSDNHAGSTAWIYLYCI